MGVGETISNETTGASVRALISWTEFQEIIQKEPYNSTNYIWRGQRDSAWGLESGLDRFLKGLSPEQKATRAERHLGRFKQASRGRRGENPNQPTNDDEWWALAQHNAMLTPLLDWTDSPFVALYFAFEKAQTPASRSRSVWALSTLVRSRDEIETRISTKRQRDTLDIIRPLQGDNSRLLNQAGLFTKVPSGTTVETWLAEGTEVEQGEIALTKFIIPEDGREDCLRLLNRMNINHLSLFPDLYGAGKHCNNVLQIDNY